MDAVFFAESSQKKTFWTDQSSLGTKKKKNCAPAPRALIVDPSAFRVTIRMSASRQAKSVAEKTSWQQPLVLEFARAVDHHNIQVPPRAADAGNRHPTKTSTFCWGLQSIPDANRFWTNAKTTLPRVGA